AVVAGGQLVAVEAGRHQLVGHDPGPGPARVGRLLLEGPDAHDVVDVAVGVDDGLEGQVGPAPDVGVVGGRQHVGAGVDEDEAAVGREGADVAEAGDEGGAGRHLLQPEVAAHR